MKESFFVQLATQALVAKPHPDPRFPPSPYYRFLRLLAQSVQPNLSVELGVCGGGGSFHLCLGWPQGKVVGVEHGKEYPENIRYIKETCLNYVHWIGDSVASALLVHTVYGRAKILFIDTTHTYEQTLAEFNAWKPFLEDGAVVCLDDLFRPGMPEAWDALPGRKVRLDCLHDGGGPGIGGGFGVVF